MKTLFSLIALSLISVFSATAQFTGSKYNMTPASNVYIVMPDTTSPESKAYLTVYKKYWTFSKFTVIMPDDKAALARPGALFFGFTCFKRKEFNSQRMKNELIYMQVNLSLYHFLKDEVKKGPQTYSESEIASFKMNVNNRDYFDKLIDADFFFGSSKALDAVPYDLEGNVFLWSPGLLKNHIQKLQLMISSKKPADADNSKGLSLVDDLKGLAKLSGMTLYVPECTLMEYNKMSNTWKEELKDDKKLFEKYPHEYELISTDELSQKILNSQEDFYYLVWINDGPRKYVNIVSAKTGKVVYSEFSTPAYEFNKNDIKDLMKAMGGE